MKYSEEWLKLARRYKSFNSFADAVYNKGYTKTYKTRKNIYGELVRRTEFAMSNIGHLDLKDLYKKAKGMKK